MTKLLRIRRLSQLVVVNPDASKLVLRGAEMNELTILEDATVVVDENGVIEDVGPDEVLEAKYSTETFAVDLDGRGQSLIPSFTDAHTHPVWSGDRVNEFAMKLAGATYMDIHKAGGGIGFTVNCTRSSSTDELLSLLLPRLKRMLRQGTTVVECKSGYGLEAATELKQLLVIEAAKSQVPMELVSTFLGAHSIPKGSTAAQATEDVVGVQLPALAHKLTSGELHVENIDVFMEKGVFSYQDTLAILRKGKELGLRINFHGDELTDMNSGAMALEVGATAVSHLEEISSQGIKLLKEAGTVAVLLPTTAYVLRLKPPPARDMISEGVAVALGSDYNPNAHCLSMPMVMNLACVLMKMTMNEALVAATLNSAASLNRSDKYGSIVKGKFGDFVLINAPSWQHIIYQFGDPPIEQVFHKGKPVL